MKMEQGRELNLYSYKTVDQNDHFRSREVNSIN